MSRFWCLLFVAVPSIAFAQNKTREEKVREDRAKVEADGFWMYNDLPGAFAKARQTGKPLLVVLRCIPCEECVKLDDDLVDKDPIIRPLLDQFVCVRQVSTNGLDLNLFQYDTDQSFAVFMLNADGTIYGRFGTRSHRTEWVGDVSVAGMAKALQGALELHADYPANKESLAGKRGESMEVASPELYPSLKERYTDRLNYQGDVVKSCIHCHQIGDAQREWYRAARKPIPERVLFPYPHPKAVGLTMNPAERATVKRVAEGSPAESAGLQPGDRIESFDGQPMLSTADVQWVLHNVDPAGGQVPLRIDRDGTSVDLSLTLKEGWRREGDISWRVTSWGLRRMATGGMVLERLAPEARSERGASQDGMALLVKRVGQYGAHATAKKAGFRENDVIIEFGGRDDLTQEADLLAYGVTELKPGEAVDVTVLRGGRKKTLKLPMQK